MIKANSRFVSILLAFLACAIPLVVFVYGHSVGRVDRAEKIAFDWKECTCNCESPHVVEWISGYEELDPIIGPRNEQGSVPKRSIGQCIRIRGVLYKNERGGSRFRTQSKLVFAIEPRGYWPTELNGDEVEVVLRGCICREWYPPLPVTPIGAFGESRRRGLTRNHLQARPVGYVYSIGQCQVISVVESP